MNKEQQELSETRMGAELPPLSVTESDRLRAERLTELEWLAAYAECSPIEMVATRYCRERQLLAVLERERELQAEIQGVKDALGCSGSPDVVMTAKLCYQQWTRRISEVAAAEAQLLAKDALIASLNDSLQSTLDRESATTSRYDAKIEALEAEILKQNKAEDELLATGEKLAEERK